MQLSEIDEVILRSSESHLSREVHAELREMLAETKGYERRSLVQLRELYDMDGDPDGWSRFRRSFLGDVAGWYGSAFVRGPIASEIDKLNLMWLLSPPIFVYLCCCIYARAGYLVDRGNLRLIHLTSAGVYGFSLDRAREVYETEYHDIVDVRMYDTGGPPYAIRAFEHSLLETIFIKPEFLGGKSLSVINPSVPMLVSFCERSGLVDDFFSAVKDLIIDLENGIVRSA